MWHKGVRWHHVESDILKEGPGQKHPGRWEIAERQIPCVKMLFKINTEGHKHPSIRLFIIEQDTIGKPKKTKSGNQPWSRTLPQFSSIYLSKGEKPLVFRLSFVNLLRAKDGTHMFDAKLGYVFVV